MSGVDCCGSRNSTYVSSALRVLGLILLLSSSVILGGIGLVAVVGSRGNTLTWERWGSVGEAFGVVNSLVSVLAVAAVLITWSTQYRILREQKIELLRQGQNQEDRIELAHRERHVGLIRLAIEHPHLASVWPRIAGSDPIQESQHMYANLILQNIWTDYLTGRSSYEQVINNLRYLFASPAIQEFWRASESSRRRICVDDSGQAEFESVADGVWRECETFLSGSIDVPASANINPTWSGIGEPTQSSTRQEQRSVPPMTEPADSSSRPA